MTDSIHITVGDDILPPDSDIVIKIDFEEEVGSAARVFEIAADMIRAFEDLDRVLISSIDTSIRTQLILEDLQKSSIKVFLRNVLNQTDDQALKDLDWKPQVGKYLVKAKYAALQWLDKDLKDSDPAPISDLTENIQKLAAETDARHLPDYPPINPSRLAQPLDAIQRAKSKFRDGEALTITLDDNEYSVDLKSDWIPSEHLPETETEQELSNTVDMVLVIRKPDFLGAAQWNFKHGSKALNAPIEDEDWMRRFHLGDVTIKPGDALRVRIRFVYKYDAKGDLIESDEKIVKVLNVIKAAIPPEDLFDDE